jgi:guanylate kinase
VVQLSEEAVRMELRDLFEELDVGASVEVKEAIANRIDASNAAIRVLDEIDEIIANKLLAAALA